MSNPRPLHRFSRHLQFGLVALYTLTMLVALLATHLLTRNILIANLYYQSKDFIRMLPDNGNESDLIHWFEREKGRLFFRVTLLNSDMMIFYDTQGIPVDPTYLQEHYKLAEARERGYSYDQHFSSTTQREMAYITIPFNYNGQVYLIRASFPSAPFQELEARLQLTFFAICSLTFLIFGTLTVLLIRRLNRPLESVLQIVSQKGPEILDPTSGVTLIQIQDLPHDFDTLISTLNGLSEQVNRSLSTLTRERNERDAILRSMVEGVLSISSSIEILYANPAAYQLLELDPKAGRDALQANRYNQIRTLCQSCLERRNPVIEQISLPGDHKSCYLEVLINPTSDGKLNLLVRDISQQHELNEMRKSFVANASHELRTPITIIRGFAETLADHPEISGEMLQSIMQKIAANCERMNNLITHLMNLSKNENLPLQDLTAVDLNQIGQLVVDQMLAVHPSARIRFTRCPSPAYLLGQGVLVSIVIKNLVENAIKYSDGPARVELKIHVANEILEVTIRDHGIGIPESDLPYIFERFYTVDKARSKKAGGFGLGLSMVKTIVDKHGGTIEVQSKSGQGTCFCMRFARYHPPKKNRHLVEPTG